MVTESDLYTIVLIGRINPPIHSPHWYHNNGQISEDDLRHAIEAPTLVVFPHLAHFSTPSFDVTASAERWEIKTLIRAQVDRLANITEAVFDGLLPHTPIRSCGFNLVRTRFLLGSPRQLVAAAAKTGLDFGLGDLGVAEIKVGTKGGEHRDTISIVPVEEGVRFSANIHYEWPPAQSPDEFRPFKLGPTLQEFSVRIAESEAKLDQLLAQLEAM